MATNFHKDLPNSQLHNPKDFSSADASSVCVKNESSLLEWLPANYTTSTTILCTADVKKSLSGLYFYLYTSNDAISYQVWFDVSSTPGTLSIDSGYTGYEIDITEDDSANTVASTLAGRLNAISGVTAAAVSATVTVSTIITATDPTNISTPFTFSSTRTGVADEYLTTDGSGNIQWEAQPADADTTYSAATSSTLGLLKIEDDTEQSVAAESVSATSNRTYGVQFNSSDQAVVNVPWADTNTRFDSVSWRGAFTAKYASDVNDWFILTASSGTTHTFQMKTNLGGSVTTLDPIVALQGSVYMCNAPMTVTGFRALLTGSGTIGEDVTLNIYKATPAAGTGNWAITQVSTTGTLAVDDTQVDFFSDSSFGVEGDLLAGDVIIPLIKVDIQGGNMAYLATMQFQYV
jgi:hypothetical protein